MAQQQWLIPIDESGSALLPLDWVINNLPAWRETPQIHLLNVQPNLSRDIGRFINADTLKEFHLESGMKALAPARAKLEAAGITPETHVLVGEAAPTIIDFAESKHCTQILLGTRGHSGLAGTLLGSVAMKLVHLSRIPVLLIR
jgi:nucleotide-binding universal stress UspA family protein